jgi:hypothetical protein
VRSWPQLAPSPTTPTASSAGHRPGLQGLSTPSWTEWVTSVHLSPPSHFSLCVVNADGLQRSSLDLCSPLPCPSDHIQVNKVKTALIVCYVAVVVGCGSTLHFRWNPNGKDQGTSFLKCLSNETNNHGKYGTCCQMVLFCTLPSSVSVVLLGVGLAEVRFRKT